MTQWTITTVVMNKAATITFDGQAITVRAKGWTEASNGNGSCYLEKQEPFTEEEAHRIKTALEALRQYV